MRSQNQRAQNSLIASLASLDNSARHRILSDLTDSECAALLHDWQVWARPQQLPPPGRWTTWLILAGRGWGKTRAGAEWVIAEVRSGRRGRLALIGRAAAEVRDVMIEGPSGIMTVSPPWFRPTYEPSKRRLSWPNGARAITYAAEEPDQLRGPEHDGAWADEIRTWPYAEAWDNLMLTLRGGDDPRCVATTTPRPGHPVIKALLSDPMCTVTRGSTYENVAHLAPSFIDRIVHRYEGTRLGRQELYAELLDDNPAALWRREWIDAQRVVKAPPLVRVVVAVDPGASSEHDAAETGIVVAGRGEDGHGYVLADVSMRGTPAQWAAAAVAAYHTFRADRIVAEINHGGEMVEHTLRAVDAAVSYRAVHATRAKFTRAEPIAALAERGRIHYVGTFIELEDQLCTWVPGGPSPDRLDAFVWAMTELLGGEARWDGSLSAGTVIVGRPAALTSGPWAT